MENTCKKEKCKLWKKYKDSCPNYISCTYMNEKTKLEKRVEDCAPIRTMLMVQDLYSRLIGLQKDVSKQEKTTIRFINEFAKAFNDLNKEVVYVTDSKIRQLPHG